MARSSDPDRDAAGTGASTGTDSLDQADSLDRTDESNDPLRPSDHIDYVAPSSESRGGAGGDITQPRLGPVGYLRFFWRQLTSMRTALFLLLLLALAAVPGSLVPQRTSDPNGVVQYKRRAPAAVPGARPARGLQHLLVAVVLGHLPAAVHLAGRLHHPAHQAPLRRAARAAAEDPGAPLAAGRVPPSRWTPPAAPAPADRSTAAERGRRGARAAEARRATAPRCTATR